MQGTRPMQSGSGFSKSIEGIATVVAVAITFILAPLLIGASAGFVREFAYAHYGEPR